MFGDSGGNDELTLLFFPFEYIHSHPVYCRVLVRRGLCETWSFRLHSQPLVYFVGYCYGLKQFQVRQASPVEALHGKEHAARPWIVLICDLGTFFFQYFKLIFELVNYFRLRVHGNPAPPFETFVDLYDNNAEKQNGLMLTE